MSSEPTERFWLRPLLFLAVFAAFLLLLYKTSFFHLFMDREKLHVFIKSLGGWGFAGFIFLQALQVVAAPVPGEATGLLGGYLYGPYLGTLLSTAGLTLGSWAAFALSRAFGRPLTDRFVDRGTMARFDYLLHHKGVFLVFVLFLIPGFPKDILCYILGLGHLTTLEFLAIASTGRLLGTAMLTLTGHFLRDKDYANLFVMAGFAIIAVIAVIVFKDRIEKRLRAWSERLRRK